MGLTAVTDMAIKHDATNIGVFHTDRDVRDDDPPVPWLCSRPRRTSRYVDVPKMTQNMPYSQLSRATVARLTAMRSS